MESKSFGNDKSAAEAHANSQETPAIVVRVINGKPNYTVVTPEAAEKLCKDGAYTHSFVFQNGATPTRTWKTKY